MEDLSASHKTPSVTMTGRKMKSKVKVVPAPTTESAEKFTFFWKTASPFSQFHSSPFTALPLFITTEEDKKGYEFAFCEQWMMFNKAKLFKDEATAEKILQATEPQECKALGRSVTPFDLDVWSEHNERIVKEGNRHKFTQNPKLLKALMDTEGTTLVEASPVDRLYGIGLSANNPKALSRATWRGRNLLGEILTVLRDELKAGGDEDDQAGEASTSSGGK